MRNEDGWVRCSDELPTLYQACDSYGNFTVFWTTVERTFIDGSTIRYGLYLTFQNLKWCKSSVNCLDDDEVVIAWKPKTGLYQGPT